MLLLLIYEENENCNRSPLFLVLVEITLSVHNHAFRDCVFEHRASGQWNVRAMLGRVHETRGTMTMMGNGLLHEEMMYLY